jgi:hypothetical protein
MKAYSLLLSALCICLAGCINLPQTKALITPAGVIGVHSFAPPEAKRSTDFEQRIAQQRNATPADTRDDTQDRS